jgi:hypothetical protein
MSQQVSDAELLSAIKKMYLKTNQILAMMKNGEFIIAYEKLGGVLKNMSALGAVLEKRIPEDNHDFPDVPALPKGE